MIRKSICYTLPPLLRPLLRINEGDVPCFITNFAVLSYQGASSGASVLDKQLFNLARSVELQKDRRRRRQGRKSQRKWRRRDVQRPLHIWEAPPGPHPGHLLGPFRAPWKPLGLSLGARLGPPPGHLLGPCGALWAPPRPSGHVLGAL